MVALTARTCWTQWMERWSQTLASQTLQSRLQLDRTHTRVTNIHTEEEDMQSAAEVLVSLVKMD